MKTMTKSPSNEEIDQEKLKVICDDLCENIEDLLDHLEIEYKVNNKLITMCCPIHDGDNCTALNIYPEGEYVRGNWVCRTHGCEKVFKNSIIGFVRGVISNRKYGWNQKGDKFCSFKEAIDYSVNFLNKDYSEIKVNKENKEKKNFSTFVNYIKNNHQDSTPKIKREQIIKNIKIPSQYYIDRNYSSEILIKYDIGLCDNIKKPMCNRVVVPIYDNNYHHMVGCSGRSIFDKCIKCSCYHNPNQYCPNEDKKYLYSKWKHSLDFKSQNHLYNFWFAKKYILETSTAVIVESPGNVWRLEENGIHNSVAIFGSSLSDRQKILLDSSGAMNLILLTDNDDAGIKASEQIKNKCQNTYRIFIPKISKNDVGEMNSEEINTEIKSFMEKIV
jgi:5S rRNA maturation endonuclease (ribonuclease M5)